MTDMDLSNLRPWLDEHENYARTILPGDPRFEVAKEMLGIVTMARDSLHPSQDSTANFVQNKEIIERLVTLRNEAQNIVKG